MKSASIHETHFCQSCENAAKPKVRVKGHILIELMLWCLFLLPGLIYSVWRLTTKERVCRACGGADIIPYSSPRGKRLVDEKNQRDREQQEREEGE